MDYPFFFLRFDRTSQLFTRAEANTISRILTDYDISHFVDVSRLSGKVYDPHSVDQSQPMPYGADVYFDGEELMKHTREIMTILTLTIGRLTVVNRNRYE